MQFSSIAMRNTNLLSAGRSQTTCDQSGSVFPSSLTDSSVSLRSLQVLAHCLPSCWLSATSRSIDSKRYTSAVCWVDKPEHIVENVVRASLRHESEGLHIIHRLWLIIDHESSCHQHYYSVVLTWLRIHCVGSVLDFLKRKALYNGQSSDTLPRKLS